MELRSKLLLNKLFQVKVRETRTCCDSYLHGCPPRISLRAPLDVIPLPVQGSMSLQLSVDMYHGLGGGGIVTVNCNTRGCHSRDAEFSSEFHGEPPRALIFQLQRAVPDSQAQPGTLVKLGHSIKVPGKYQPKAGGPYYVLTGALNQLGEEANTGHYVTLTRDLEDGSFILGNDANPLKKMTEEEVLRYLTTSYMFIYCREDYRQDTRGRLGEEAVLGDRRREEVVVVEEEGEGESLACSPQPSDCGNLSEQCPHPQVMY